MHRTSFDVDDMKEEVMNACRNMYGTEGNTNRKQYFIHDKSTSEVKDEIIAKITKVTDDKKRYALDAVSYIVGMKGSVLIEIV